ncbi:MAG TPA: hypothetical protein VHS97_11895 [Isosphaeraceae bacterium]|jgi:hypothetical protein|nr:hypothetical protein [Isosphaeraceae bacterium]
MSQAVEVKPQAEVIPPEDELKVLGESTYDRVTSLLMAVVLGAILVVGWLALVYASNQAYASRVTSPLQIIEVGGGGGSPDGTPGSTEKVDVAGADAATAASNNQEEAGDFEEPSVEQTPGAMMDTVSEASQSLAEVDLGATMPTGGPVAGGKRASKLGTGGPGLGFGPGDGGVAREQRWSIVYTPGQTIDQYARQLDALGVEMAVVASAEQLLYISHFSNPTPTKRHGTGRSDHRLYFLWQGRGRKPSDIELFKRAGVEIGDENVFQFYSPEAERRLAELEVRYKGRSPGEIRITRFQVVAKGSSYDFAVVAQETLR